MPPRRSTRSSAAKEAQPPKDEAPVNTTIRRTTRSSKRNASQAFPEPSQQTPIITHDEVKPTTKKRVPKGKAASTDRLADTKGLVELDVEETTLAPMQPAKRTRSKVASADPEQTRPRGKSANTEPTGASADKDINQRQTDIAKMESAEEPAVDSKLEVSVTPTKRTRAMLAEDEVEGYPKLRKLESGPLSRAQDEVPKRRINRRKKAASPQRLTDPFTELSTQTENVPPTLPSQEPVKRTTRSKKSQNAQDSSAIDRTSRSKANQKTGTLESIVPDSNAAEEVQEAVDQQVVQEAETPGPRGRKGKTPKKTRVEAPVVEEALLPGPVKSRGRTAKGVKVQQTGTTDVEVKATTKSAVPKETQLPAESMVAITKEDQASRPVPSSPARRSIRNKLTDQKAQPGVILELQQPSHDGDKTVANTNVGTKPQYKDDISITCAEAPAKSLGDQELEEKATITTFPVEEDIEHFDASNKISLKLEDQNVPDTSMVPVEANTAAEETNAPEINSIIGPIFLETGEATAVSIATASHRSTESEVLLQPVLQSPLPAPVVFSPSQTNQSFAEPTKSPISTSSFAMSPSLLSSREIFDDHSQAEVTPTSSPGKGMVSYPSTPLASSRGKPTSEMELTTPVHSTEEHSPYTPKDPIKLLDVFSSPILQPPPNLVAEEERSGKSPVKNATPRNSLKVITATSITEGVENILNGGSFQTHDSKASEKEVFSCQKEIEAQTDHESDFGGEEEKSLMEVKENTHTYGYDMTMELPPQDEEAVNDDHNLITADSGANIETPQQSPVEVSSQSDGNMMEDHAEQDSVEISNMGVGELARTNVMAHSRNESPVFESVVGEVEDSMVYVGEESKDGMQDLNQQPIGETLIASQLHGDNEATDGSTTVILNDYPTSAESFHENHEDHGDINENSLLLLKEIKDDFNRPTLVDNFLERASLREADFSNLSAMFPFGNISGEVDVSAMIREFEKEDAEKDENSQKADTPSTKVDDLDILVPGEVTVDANAQEKMEIVQDSEDNGEEMLPAFMTSPEFSNLGSPQRATASPPCSLLPQPVAALSPRALAVFDNTVADDSCGDDITWDGQSLVELGELEKEEAIESEKQEHEKQGTGEGEILKFAMQSYPDLQAIDEEHGPTYVADEGQEDEKFVEDKEEQSEGEGKEIKIGVLEDMKDINEVVNEEKEIKSQAINEETEIENKVDEVGSNKNRHSMSEEQTEVGNRTAKLETAGKAETENGVQEEEDINNTRHIEVQDQVAKSDEPDSSEKDYFTTSGSVDRKSPVILEDESVGNDTPSEVTQKQVSFATPKAVAHIAKKPRFSLTPPLSSSTPKRSLDESPTKLRTPNEWSPSSYHINPEDIPDFDDDFSFMESPAQERQTPVSDHKATAVVGDSAQINLSSPMKPVHALLSQFQAGDFEFDDEFSYIEEDTEDTGSVMIVDTPTRPSQSSKSPMKRLSSASKLLSSPLKGTGSPIRRSSRLSPFKRPGLPSSGPTTPSKVPSSPHNYGSDVSSLKKKPIQSKQPVGTQTGTTQENLESQPESSSQRKIPHWEVQILPRPVIIDDKAVVDPNISINKRKISTTEPSPIKRAIKRAKYEPPTLGKKVTKMENQEASLDIGESHSKISSPRSKRRQSRLSYLDSAFSNAAVEPEPQACPDSVQCKRRGRRTSNTQRRQSFELEANTHLYTRLQALCRGYIYRNQLQVDQTELKLAAEVFISAWRGLKQRRQFLALRAASIKIQQTYRAYREKKQSPSQLPDLNTTTPLTEAEEQTLSVSSNRFSGLFKRYEERRAAVASASNLRATESEEKVVEAKRAESKAPISEPIVSYMSTPRRRRMARPSPVPEKFIFRRKASTVLAKEALAAQTTKEALAPQTNTVEEDTENQVEIPKPAATRIPRAGLRLPTASVLDTVSTGKRKAEDEINETIAQKPKLTPAPAATPGSRLRPPARLTLKASASGSIPQLPTPKVLAGNISLGLGSNPFGKRPQNLAKMTQLEINQLTSSHTQSNRKYNIDFEREVVRVDRNRALSPDAETQHRRAWEERLRRYEFQEETGIVLGPGDPMGWEPEVVTPTRKAVRWHADLEFGWSEDLEKTSPSTAKQVESNGLKGIIRRTLPLDGFGNALGLAPTHSEPPMTVRITKQLFTGEEDDS